MLGSKYSPSQRPRELRRRVVLPARLRTGAQWSDACILNISSRGMMIHSGRAGPEGTRVELRRGEHVIIARVMWCDGGPAGLRSDERLPVEEIMSLSQSSALQLVASGGDLVDRRKSPRPRTRFRVRRSWRRCGDAGAGHLADGSAGVGAAARRGRGSSRLVLRHGFEIIGELLAAADPFPVDEDLRRCGDAVLRLEGFDLLARTQDAIVKRETGILKHPLCDQAERTRVRR